MKPQLEIGDTGVAVTDILELMSQGYTYGQIQEAFPRLTSQDVQEAARLAYDFIVRHMIIDTIFGIDHRSEGPLGWGGIPDDHPKRAESRPVHRQWQADEENELVLLYQNGARVCDIARIFQCKENEILSSLKRLGMVD